MAYGTGTRRRIYISSLQKQMFLRAFIISFAAILMQTLAGIIDNFIVVGYYGEEEIASVSLVKPFFLLLEVPAAGLASGIQTVCAKELGAGRIDRVNRIFNQILQFSAVMLILLTIFAYLLVPQMAYLFGARNNAASLLGPTSQYLYGLIFEIIPYVLFCIITPVIILDNGGRTIMIASVCGCLTDVLLDLYCVHAGYGLMGIGLATSASALVYLAVTLLHFLGKDRIIHLSLTPFEWKEVREVIDRGLPKAFYSLADAVRSAIIILMITTAGGVMGASVLTVHSTIGYGLEIFSTGLAGAVAILAGICCGEKNGDDLEGIGILAHRYFLTISAATALILAAAAKPLADAYMKSDASESLMIFAVACLIVEVPFVTLVRLRISYLQAIGKARAAQWVGVATHVVILLVCAGILMIPFGVRGVFVSLPLSYLIVLIRVWLDHVKSTGKLLPSGADYLEVDDSFFAGPGDVISYTVDSAEDCALASEQVSLFCRGHKIDEHTGYLAGLCTEELFAVMMGDDLHSGQDAEPADIRVVIDGKDVIVRLRNAGPPLSLTSLAERISGEEESFSDTGLRIILSSSRDLNYYRTYGMNTTILRI